MNRITAQPQLVGDSTDASTWWRFKTDSSPAPKVVRNHHGFLFTCSQEILSYMITRHHFLLLGPQPILMLKSTKLQLPFLQGGSQPYLRYAQFWWIDRLEMLIKV